jgi:hypothetical protein
MAMLRKSIIIAMLLIGGVAASTQNPATAQIVSSSPVLLPDVNVQGQPAPNPNPHHYKVPVGYDSDVAMHPYTSGLGPCTEGATPSQGCRHSTGTPIPPSHYEQAPFNR